MGVWNDDSNCGKVSQACPSLPCGQNCLYTVSWQPFEIRVTCSGAMFSPLSLSSFLVLTKMAH